MPISVPSTVARTIPTSATRRATGGVGVPGCPGSGGVSVYGAAPAAVAYGRASKSAAHALMAKMYLNVETYLGAGNSRNAECATYCEKIINSGAFQLDDVYQDLFLADNHTSPEIIFPLLADAVSSQSYGNTTYIVPFNYTFKVPKFKTPSPNN
mgnify:CR=1 FL=1